MFRFCRDNGFTQHTPAPTHAAGGILDLVITDISADINVSIEPVININDHNPIICNLRINTPTHMDYQARTLWDFRHADWSGLNRFLGSHDWSWIQHSDVDHAVYRFTRMLHAAFRRHIPILPPIRRSPTHPWLTDSCITAIKHKLSSIGTTNECSASRQCSQTLYDEFMKHVANVRPRLRRLRQGSKQWWKLSQQLLTNPSKMTSIPPLLNSTTQQWSLDAPARARLLASTFTSRWTLPPTNDATHTTTADTDVNQLPPLPTSTHHTPTTIKLVHRQLSTLDPDNSTGPDGIPTRILKRCARALTTPVAHLARRILASGHWPTAWCHHWITPIHKRGPTSNPSNYRGIHLTSQLSKVLERIISIHFIPTCSRTLAYGPHHFAYTK